MKFKRILFFILLFGIFQSKSMVPPHIALINHASQLYTQRRFNDARQLFEQLYDKIQNDPISRASIDAALTSIYYNGLQVAQDYQRALRYAIDGYNLTNNWNTISVSPEREQVRVIFVQCAYYLGIIYKNGHGIEANLTKALRYLSDAYRASDNLIYKTNCAEELGEIYAKHFALDNDNAKAIAFFREVEKLSHDPQAIKRVQGNLKALEIKEPINIIFSDGSSKKIDLQSVDALNHKETFLVLRERARAHKTDFLISRVQILNENNEIGSFYTEAKALIPWIWGLSAYYTSFFSKENYSLEIPRRSHLDDGRKIIGIDFFKWNAEKNSLEYIFNDNDLFEGYAGRRNRLFLATSDYSDSARQAFSCVLFAEMVFLGLGGDKNLTQALKYIDFAFSKNLLKGDGEKIAKFVIAQIWLDLALDYVSINPDESMKYFQRVAFQTDNPTAQVYGLMYLNKKYYEEKNFEKALFIIDKLLVLKNLPLPVVKFYTEEKQKIEKLKLQVRENAQQKLPITQQEIKPLLPAKDETQHVQEPEAPVRVAPVPDKPQAVLHEDVTKKSEVKLEEELKLSQEQKEAFDAIAYQVNAQKVMTLLKKFAQSFEAYREDRRNVSSLKDAKEALDKIITLPINDDQLAERIVRAQQLLHAELQKISEKVETAAASTAIKPRIILDPFNERENLPAEIQKTLDDNLQALIKNPFACGAEKVQSLAKYNVMRIKIGKDYRILYIFSGDMLGIVAIEKRGKSTYNKLDEKYNSHIKWFADAAGAHLSSCLL